MIKSFMINGNSIMQTHKAISFYNTHYNGHTHQIKFEIYFSIILFCFAFFFSFWDWGEHPGICQKKSIKQCFFLSKSKPFQNEFNGIIFLVGSVLKLEIYINTDRPNNKWFEYVENDTLMCYFVLKKEKKYPNNK